MADLMTATTDTAELENKYGNFIVPAMKIKSSGNDLISSNDLSVTEMEVTLSVLLTSEVRHTCDALPQISWLPVFFK